MLQPILFDQKPVGRIIFFYCAVGSVFVYAGTKELKRSDLYIGYCFCCTGFLSVKLMYGRAVILLSTGKHILDKL